jgi:hypothetical protein
MSAVAMTVNLRPSNWKNKMMAGKTPEMGSDSVLNSRSGRRGASQN